MEDLQAIAAAATAAAEKAENAAQAAVDAGTAAQSTAGERGLTLPDEVIKQIADASAASNIALLEARGAFRSDPEPAPDPAPAAGEPVDEPPVTPPTFAQKWLGVR
jgi:hypothetical protein